MKKIDRLGCHAVYDCAAVKEDWRQAGMGGLSGKGR